MASRIHGTIHLTGIFRGLNIQKSIGLDSLVTCETHEWLVAWKIHKFLSIHIQQGDKRTGGRW